MAETVQEESERILKGVNNAELIAKKMAEARALINEAKAAWNPDYVDKFWADVASGVVKTLST